MRAVEDTPDKQGRITIPPLLKEYAALDRDVVVIGALNRVEIWDPTDAAWETSTPDVRRHEQDVFPDLSEDDAGPRPHHDHTTTSTTTTTTTTTTQRDSQSEVSRPLRRVIWGTFPGSRRPSPPRTRLTP